MPFVVGFAFPCVFVTKSPTKVSRGGRLRPARPGGCLPPVRNPGTPGVSASPRGFLPAPGVPLGRGREGGNGVWGWVFAPAVLCAKSSPDHVIIANTSERMVSFILKKVTCCLFSRLNEPAPRPGAAPFPVCGEPAGDGRFLTRGGKGTATRSLITELRIVTPAGQKGDPHGSL